MRFMVKSSEPVSNYADVVYEEQVVDQEQVNSVSVFRFFKRSTEYLMGERQKCLKITEGS